MALSDRPNAPGSNAVAVANQIPLNQQAQGNAALPALLVLTSSTETVVANPGNAAVALTCSLPPDTAAEQTVLDLVASGIVTTSNSTNLTIKLYEGTSLTVGSDTLLKSSGTVAVNSKTANWKVACKLQYNSVSGVMDGTVEFLVNGSLVANAAFTNAPTGISNTGNPVASFLLSFTSSAAASGNTTTVNVQKFSVG